MTARQLQANAQEHSTPVVVIDHDKIRRLDQLVAQKMGFDATYAVTGQTYTRKIDSQVIDVLSGVAQSAHKMATDLRLLANRKEIEEPFEEKQIGSSAMAYKRNPMRCERICSLSRFVVSLQSSPANTVATQPTAILAARSSERSQTAPM